MADYDEELDTVVQMSGQKYKRTNFEEDDNSLADRTPPGVNYDPAVAFRVGATFCHRRSSLERLLLVLVAVLGIAVLVLAVLLGSHSHPGLSTGDGRRPTPQSPSPQTPSSSSSGKYYRSLLKARPC